MSRQVRTATSLGSPGSMRGVPRPSDDFSPVSNRAAATAWVVCRRPEKAFQARVFSGAFFVGGDRLATDETDFCRTEKGFLSFTVRAVARECAGLLRLDVGNLKLPRPKRVQSAIAIVNRKFI